MGMTFSTEWDRKALIAHLLDKSTWGENFNLIAHTTTGNNLWIVVERLENAKPKYRFIALYAMQNGGEEHGWGYKDMDESCGPNAVNCPLKYFELAPWNEEHLGKGYAREWRERVKAYWQNLHESRELAKKLKKGSEFRTLHGYGYFYAGNYSRDFVLVKTISEGKYFKVRKDQIDFRTVQENPQPVLGGTH